MIGSILIGCSIAMAFMGVDGWGRFLFAGVLCS